MRLDTIPDWDLLDAQNEVLEQMNLKGCRYEHRTEHLLQRS